MQPLVSPQNDPRNFTCTSDVVLLFRIGLCLWLVMLWGKIIVCFHQSEVNTQTWLVTNHQYGYFCAHSSTWFHGKTSGDIAKCLLFPQPKWKGIRIPYNSRMSKWFIASCEQPVSTITNQNLYKLTVYLQWFQLINISWKSSEKIVMKI